MLENLLKDLSENSDNVKYQEVVVNLLSLATDLSLENTEPTEFLYKINNIKKALLKNLSNDENISNVLNEINGNNEQITISDDEECQMNRSTSDQQTTALNKKIDMDNRNDLNRLSESKNNGDDDDADAGNDDVCDENKPCKSNEEQFDTDENMDISKDSNEKDLSTNENENNELSNVQDSTVPVCTATEEEETNTNNDQNCETDNQIQQQQSGDNLDQHRTTEHQNENDSSRVDILNTETEDKGIDSPMKSNDFCETASEGHSEPMKHAIQFNGSQESPRKHQGDDDLAKQFHQINTFCSTVLTQNEKFCTSLLELENNENKNDFCMNYIRNLETEFKTLVGGIKNVVLGSFSHSNEPVDKENESEEERQLNQKSKERWIDTSTTENSDSEKSHQSLIKRKRKKRRKLSDSDKSSSSKIQAVEEKNLDNYSAHESSATSEKESADHSKLDTENIDRMVSSCENDTNEEQDLEPVSMDDDKEDDEEKRKSDRSSDQNDSVTAKSPESIDYQPETMSDPVAFSDILSDSEREIADIREDDKEESIEEDKEKREEEKEKNEEGEDKEKHEEEHLDKNDEEENIEATANGEEDQEMDTETEEDNLNEVINDKMEVDLTSASINILEKENVEKTNSQDYEEKEQDQLIEQDKSIQQDQSIEQEQSTDQNQLIEQDHSIEQDQITEKNQPIDEIPSENTENLDDECVDDVYNQTLASLHKEPSEMSESDDISLSQYLISNSADELLPNADLSQILVKNEPVIEKSITSSEEPDISIAHAEKDVDDDDQENGDIAAADEHESDIEFEGFGSRENVSFEAEDIKQEIKSASLSTENQMMDELIKDVDIDEMMQNVDIIIKDDGTDQHNVDESDRQNIEENDQHDVEEHDHLDSDDKNDADPKTDDEIESPEFESNQYDDVLANFDIDRYDFEDIKHLGDEILADEKHDENKEECRVETPENVERNEPEIIADESSSKEENAEDSRGGMVECDVIIEEDSTSAAKDDTDANKNEVGNDVDGDENDPNIDDIRDKEIDR